MKWLVVFILMVVAFQEASAQYFGGKIDISCYTGEWRYENDGEIFTLYLRDTVWVWAGIDTHSIIGTYKYSINDTVIVDNTLNCQVLSPVGMPIFGEARDIDELGNIWSLWVIVKDTNTEKRSDDEYSRLKYALGKKAPLLTMSLVGDIPWYAGIEEEMAAITGEDPNELKAVTAGCKLPYWSFPNNITFTKVIE